jgi:hypothetical protein
MRQTGSGGTGSPGDRGSHDQIEARASACTDTCVLGRLASATSMSDTARVVGEIGMIPAHRNTYANALERCATHGYRDLVTTECFEHAAATGGLSLVLYDSTADTSTSPRKPSHEDAPLAISEWGIRDR